MQILDRVRIVSNNHIYGFRSNVVFTIIGIHNCHVAIANKATSIWVNKIDLKQIYFEEEPMNQLFLKRLAALKTQYEELEHLKLNGNGLLRDAYASLSANVLTTIAEVTTLYDMYRSDYYCFDIGTIETEQIKKINAFE